MLYAGIYPDDCSTAARALLPGGQSGVFSGKPQDEHACQQGQEQDDNAEPEKDAYRNVHVRNRFACIDLIEAYAICRTADYIQYDRDKYFHVIQARTASFWHRQKNSNPGKVL